MSDQYVVSTTFVREAISQAYDQMEVDIFEIDSIEAKEAIKVEVRGDSCVLVYTDFYLPKGFIYTVKKILRNSGLTVSSIRFDTLLIA